MALYFPITAAENVLFSAPCCRPTCVNAFIILASPLTPAALFPEHAHHQRQSAAVTRSRTVTNDARSQSNTYHRAGNRKWLTWNGNVSHSAGAGSWSEILAVGEMADDKGIPVWAEIVEVRVPLRFFLRGGRCKDLLFLLWERLTVPLDRDFLLLSLTSFLGVYILMILFVVIKVLEAEKVQRSEPGTRLLMSAGHTCSLRLPYYSRAPCPPAIPLFLPSRTCR